MIQQNSNILSVASSYKILHSHCFSFLDDLPRVSAPNFLPTEQDVLRTRIKTTGITEVLFELKGLTFRYFINRKLSRYFIQSLHFRKKDQFMFYEINIL